MNCTSLHFDCSAIINMAIGAIIGFGLSVVAAYYYEKFTNKRKQKDLEKTYRFLESKNNKFDWQHWNVTNGKIESSPIDSFKKITYVDGKTFDFEWIESKGGRVEGEGKLFWEDPTHGYISFFSIYTIIYNTRKVFYRRVQHQNEIYDAIFVNAEDQGYNYVLMRKIDTDSKKNE